MNLKDICQSYKSIREQGCAHDTADQIMEKVIEELQEVQEARIKNDRNNLEEELGDLIQTTLLLADFFHIPGDQALARAHKKFKTRQQAFQEEAAAQNMDLHTASFQEKIAIWNKIKHIA